MHAIRARAVAGLRTSSRQDSMLVNTSVSGFVNYGHAKFKHPFLPSAPLWLSRTCETTNWLMTHEHRLMHVMNESLRCERAGLHESAERASRPIVVDVGTNCGVYTVAAATCGYEVFAFEVQPKCIRMMQATLAANRVPDDAVHILHQPVSDRVSQFILPAVRAHSCAGTYSFAKDEGHGARSGALALQTAVLADALPPAREIALLKVDTEGHDPCALRFHRPFATTLVLQFPRTAL